MWLFCASAGDPADSVHVTERRQPGKFLGRAQAHRTAVAGGVRAFPETIAAVAEDAVVVVGGGGAHRVHPDVMQQLQRRRHLHSHHGQLVSVRRRVLLRDEVVATAAAVAADRLQGRRFIGVTDYYHGRSRSTRQRWAH